MRFVSIFAGAVIGLAVMESFAQNEPPGAARLPAATPATTNLFTTNVIRGTNLFASTNGLSRQLGLMEAIRSALSNNYDVRIDSYVPMISRQDIEAARGAYDPILGVTADHNHVSDSTGNSESDHLLFGLNGSLPTGATYNFGLDTTESLRTPVPLAPGVARTGPGKITAGTIRQPLLRNLWIDQTRYTIAISRKQLKIDELAFRFRLISTVSLVEQQYFEWIAARENVRVQEEAVSLARRQAKEYAIRTQVGVAMHLDEQRFEAQAATSEAALLTARKNLKETENALINLISNQYEAWQGTALDPLDQLPTVPHDFDTQTSWNKAFQERPDLHELIVNLEKLGLTEKLNYNQLFPSLDLTGKYGYAGVGSSWGATYSDIFDSNKPFWSAGLEASFPLGNRTARAHLKATRLEKDQANEKLKQARQTIMVQVENAIIDGRTSWERIPATREAREYAASALDAGQKRLAAGTVTPLELLQLQRDLTSARSDEIRALVDYNKAITVLLEREGTLLKERGLTVNVQ